MKNLNDALAELVNEFAGLPTPASAQNPLTLANFCQDLENEVMALNIVSERLLFNVRACGCF